VQSLVHHPTPAFLLLAPVSLCAVPLVVSLSVEAPRRAALASD
jgi:hypothetical protein